jgi:mannosyltransferase OCH1-like enzyme
MIPKIMHRVHLGGQEPKMVSDAWNLSKKNNSDWNHITHNENNLKNFTISQKCLEYSNIYSYKSDLMRLESLYLWGGFYIDTDVFVIKSFNDLIDYDNIVVGEEDKNIICSAVIGAPPKNKEILSTLNEMVYLIDQEYKKTGSIAYNHESEYFAPTLLTKRWINNSDINVLNTEYFYPIHWRDEWSVEERDSENLEMYMDRALKSITKNTYSIHRWAGTWK